MGIKLNTIKPEWACLDELSATDGHERLFVTARKGACFTGGQSQGEAG